MTEVLQYSSQSVCCTRMQIKLNNDVIEDVDFLGGCPGNLLGIRNLVKGMKIDDVIEKFQGIPCGGKSTSCPDQLAKCLISYKASTPAS